MGERRRFDERLSRPAVFLDRDGVLNEPIVRDGHPYPPATVADVILCDGASEAMRALRDNGFALLVVTNQPDIARGTTTRRSVDEIHRFLGDHLPIDAFLVCPHDDSDACVCRKPKPGLVLRGATTHGIDLEKSYLVGDRWRDIEAGAAAGVRTIMIDRNYTERAPRVAPDARVRSVVEAANWILFR